MGAKASGTLGDSVFQPEPRPITRKRFMGEPGLPRCDVGTVRFREVTVGITRDPEATTRTQC
jgi:hypothetical protein